jgi:hypothetical protein
MRPERGTADDMVMTPIATALTMTLRAGALDRELAAGARLRGNPRLQLRGQRVTCRKRRDRLAAALERLVEQARDTRPGLTSAIPMAREEVLGAGIQLLDLACRLRSDAPVDPQGVLLIGRLLSDGASPVFLPPEPGALRGVARELNAALAPRP